jgi:hypothetical protein
MLFFFTGFSYFISVLNRDNRTEPGGLGPLESGGVVNHMSLTCFLNSDSQRNTRTNEFQKKNPQDRSDGYYYFYQSLIFLKQNKTKQKFSP